MKKQGWKACLCRSQVAGVMLAVPVLTLFFVGISYNAFQHVFTRVDWYGQEEYYWTTIRQMCSVVEAIEADSSQLAAFLVPLLSGLAVVPFLSYKDGVLAQGRVRMKHPRRTEFGAIACASAAAGGVVFAGFLLALGVSHIVFASPVHENGSADYFASVWNCAALSVYAHPYRYLLALGAVRYFLAPALYALMTIAVSYLTDKIYFILTAPTLYAVTGMLVFSNGMVVGEWLGRRLTPANLITPWAPLDSGAAANWFLVLPSALMLAVSLICIAAGRRKQLA